MRVVKLVIDNINPALIPSEDDPNFILYNPHLDKNKIINGAMSEIVKKGLRKIELSASDSAEADLRVPFLKYFVNIGQIKSIRGYEKENLRTYYRSDENKVEIAIPDPNEEPHPIELSEQIVNSIKKKYINKARVDSCNERKEDRKKFIQSSPQLSGA